MSAEPRPPRELAEELCIKAEQLHALLGAMEDACEARIEAMDMQIQILFCMATGLSADVAELSKDVSIATGVDSPSPATGDAA